MQVDVNNPNNPFAREEQTQQSLVDVNNPNNPFIASVINRDKNEVDVDLESGDWLLKDNLSTAAAFLEGATLGWSDEAGVGVAAAAVSATGDETYEQAYKRLKEIIREYKPDIVHTHASKAGALGRKAANACNVPVVVHTFHGHVFHSLEQSLGF